MMDLDKDFLFPFRDIDDEEFVNINKDCVCDHLQSHCKYDNLNFKTFNHIKIENNIDPENHFFNNV